ncbi:MAG: ArsR/SmtB family transcription factor [Tepidisphaerales bacterium]
MIMQSQILHKSRSAACGNYGPLARVLKAVADPIRLAILDQVRDGERSVWDIANGVGAERSNVSRHLAVLAAAGVLTSRKDGVKVFYRLRTPCILSLFSCVCKVIEADVREAQAAVGHARNRGGK